jgi:hypothetical protein
VKERNQTEVEMGEEAENYIKNELNRIRQEWNKK